MQVPGMLSQPLWLHMSFYQVDRQECLVLSFSFSPLALTVFLPLPWGFLSFKGRTQRRYLIWTLSPPNVWLWVSTSAPISCQKPSLWGRFDWTWIQQSDFDFFSILGLWAIQPPISGYSGSVQHWSLWWHGPQITPVIFLAIYTNFASPLPQHILQVR